MQSGEFPVYLGVLLFIPFFVLVWMFVSALLAEISGWRLLLEKFADDGSSADGEQFRFVSAQLRRVLWLPVNYKNCLWVRVNPHGFSLQVFMLLRFRSPALFIPFTAVEEVKTEFARGFMGNHTHITFKSLPIRLMIYGPAGEAVERMFTQR